MKHSTISKMDEKSIRAYIDYVRAHSRTSTKDSDLMAKEIKGLIHRSVAIGYSVGVVEGYQLLAIVNMNKNDGEMAYNALKMSETFLDKYQLPKEHYLELYNTKVIYYQDYVGDAEMAASMCQKGIMLARELGDKPMLMKFTANLGTMHILFGNHEDALAYLQIAHDYYTSNNDAVRRLYCLANLGEAYYNSGKMTESKAHYEEALTIALASEENVIVEEAAVGLSRLYVMNDENEKSVAILEESSHNIDKHNELTLGLKLILELIRRYLSNQDYVMADLHMKRLEEGYDVHRNIMVEMDYFQLKSEIAVGFGDYQLAYQISKKHHELYMKADEAKADKILLNIKTGQLIATIDRLEKIGNVGRTLTKNLSNDHMIRILYKELDGLLALDSIGIGIIDGNRIEYDYYQGDMNDAASYEIPLSEDESFGSWVINNGKELMVNDVSAEYMNYVTKVRNKLSQLEGKVTESVIYVPLMTEDKVIGVLGVQCYSSMAYSSQDLETLKVIGSYVAIAIINASQAKELQRLSLTDPLTGLLNRNGLIGSYGEYDAMPLGSVHMVMLDLDHFKGINDQYGHVAGDDVLEIIGTLLKTIGEGALVARLGGEEFAVILINISNQACLDLAQEILVGIRDIELSYERQRVTLTTSIGIYHNADKTLPSLDHIYKYADRALYLAKSEGRNRIVVYDENKAV